MTLSRLFLAPLLAVTVFAVGCASANERDGQENVAEGKWVQQTTFDKMGEVIKTVDYLPWRYKADGCYARQLYMSMELASQGLESNAIFAFAQNGSPLVVGPITWRYHVTPLLNVGPDAEHLVPMVFDPAISPNAPLTRDQWVAAMGHGGPADLHPPRLQMVPGSDYLGVYDGFASPEWVDKDIPDFEHLPAFSTKSIQQACNVMYRYLKIEPAKPAAPVSTPSEEDIEETVLDPVAQNSPLTTAEKQAKLLDRTTALLAGLTAKEKLKADAVFSADACKRGF
jgi:hypothetical protein